MRLLLNLLDVFVLLVNTYHDLLGALKSDKIIIHPFEKVIKSSMCPGAFQKSVLIFFIYFPMKLWCAFVYWNMQQVKSEVDKKINCVFRDSLSTYDRISNHKNCWKQSKNIRNFNQQLFCKMLIFLIFLRLNFYIDMNMLSSFACAQPAWPKMSGKKL